MYLLKLGIELKADKCDVLTHRHAFLLCLCCAVVGDRMLTSLKASRERMASMLQVCLVLTAMASGHVLRVALLAPPAGALVGLQCSRPGHTCVYVTFKYMYVHVQWMYIYVLSVCRLLV